MKAWQYYTSSYIRVEPTEGVDRSKMTQSVLRRNIPRVADIEAEEMGGLPKALHFSEELSLRICVNTAKIIYGPGSSEYFVYVNRPALNEEESKAAASRLRKQKERRAEIFKEKFEMNSAWMKGLTHEKVAQATQDFNAWVGKDEAPPAASSTQDVEMA